MGYVVGLERFEKWASIKEANMNLISGRDECVMKQKWGPCVLDIKNVKIIGKVIIPLNLDWSMHFMGIVKLEGRLCLIKQYD
jgi:hypothetical protein